MNNPFLVFTKNGYKSFDFSPWGGIEGFLEASKLGSAGDATQLKKLVPDLAHAVDMTAVSISSLPFDFVDDNDNIIDSSMNWKNKMGGIPNPFRLLYLVASSLCGGSAYIIPTHTQKMMIDLQYCAPNTITPYIDTNGLQYFERRTAEGNSDKLSREEIIYFWLPDSDVEIGPAQNNPLKNATLDAQLIYNMKNTMRLYGERGFVPITLLGVKGMPSDDERQKTENFFNRLLRGGFNVLAKIINSDALSINQIGAGMQDLKQTYIELRRDAKESIADSFGIPPALFMSDNAYASEMDILRRQWYTASRFVGITQTITETFNDQLLIHYGARIRFNVEALDIFKSDEIASASALQSFVSSITTSPEATNLGMSILGYDLDDTQKKMMEEIINRKEKSTNDIKDDPEPIMSPKELVDDEKPENVMENKTAPALSADEIKDIALWMDRAKHWFKNGKGAAVDWECKHLRDDISAPIRLKLMGAKSEDDIIAAFEIGGTQETRALDRLILVLEKMMDAANADKNNID